MASYANFTTSHKLYFCQCRQITSKFIVSDEGTTASIPPPLFLVLSLWIHGDNNKLHTRAREPLGDLIERQLLLVRDNENEWWCEDLPEHRISKNLRRSIFMKKKRADFCGKRVEGAFRNGFLSETLRELLPAFRQVEDPSAPIRKPLFFWESEGGR